MTKTITCDKCNGRGYFTVEHYGHDYAGVTVLRCEVCQGKGTVDVAITNADRIRSMTDEELAAVISQKEGLVQFCGNKAECLEMLCTDAEIPDEWCMECAMEWLKQPCEEGEHENS